MLTVLAAGLMVRIADNPRIERQIQGSRVVEDKTFLLCR